jgi:hypothetical protein
VAAPFFEENLKMFGPLRLVRSLTDAQIDAMADPRRAPYAGLPTIEQAVKNGAYLCGPPSQIIDTLMRLEQEYPGLERVSVSHPMGAPESLMLEQLEWFAAEVMPPSPSARARIRAHLLRWRPRQPAQRTESTPRRLPSGAASQLDPSPRSSRASATGS